MNPTDADAKAAAQNNFENYGNLGPMDPAMIDQAKGFAQAQGWGFDPAKGYMADGGTLPMPVGKPTLVGEEGPELILPREDGRGFVLPADITEQVLPMMDGGTMMKPKGYQEGGTMPGELYTTPGFALGQGSAAMVGPSGSGTSTRFNPGSAAGRMAAMETPRMMMDPRTGYQMDMDAPGLPLVPDVVTGPWAQAGMEMTPEQREGLTRATQGYAQNLMQRPGVMSASQAYESQLVPDQRVSEQGKDRLLTAQGSLQAPQMIPLSEMRDRVLTRSTMNYQAREEAREAADRARLAALPPLGAPTAAPGMRPAVQRRMDRNMEKFLQTPQGSMWAAEQQMGQQQQQQQLQAANDWRVMNDPTTNRPMAMVNGKGQTLSLPQMEGDEKVVMVQEEALNAFGIPIVRTVPAIASVSKGTIRKFADSQTGEQVDTVPFNEGGGTAGSKPSATANPTRQTSGRPRPASGFVAATQK
jgi:hypothetical protein